MSDTTIAPRTNQRERILDVALRLMSEHGSAAMSMRRLASECGVQVAAIYHYFPSKDALLASVFEERQYSARIEMPLDIDPDASTASRLGSVFTVFWEGALLEEPVLRLLLGEGLRAQPVALPTGVALLGIFGEGVLTMLSVGVPELDDPEVVAEMIVAQVFSGFIRHIFEPDLSVERIAEKQLGILVTAVLGDRGDG